MRVAYLGPPGTFSEQAVQQCEFVRTAERLPMATFADAYEAALKGEVDSAVLPIENSIEGSIDATLDLLVHRPGLVIRREILLGIEQHLMVARGTTAASITKVLSHPQPLGQCAAFLRRRFPGVPTEATHSTAEAARRVADAPGLAAIGPAASAERYGLEILERSVQDEPGNTTRFVLVMRDDEAPTGRDKTSIAFTLDRDRPGGLYEVLGEFARRGLNLSRIASRPTRRAVGHYIFFLDFEDHRLSSPGSEALAAVRARVHTLHVLGSYPRVDGI
ncbi:MAG: prephenate dehydratase [Myxococcaceae bacterium]